MFKLIPREDPEINFKVKPLSRFKSVINPLVSKIIVLKRKLAGQLTHFDDIVLHKTSLKMFDFIKHSRQYTYKQIAELIHEMERSILCLQRKKKRLILQEVEKTKKRSR